jgi:hypothetical protein
MLISISVTCTQKDVLKKNNTGRALTKAPATGGRAVVVVVVVVVVAAPGLDVDVAGGEPGTPE